MQLDEPQPCVPPADAEPETSAAIFASGAPLYRRLRVFAFDPLLSNQLETTNFNQVTLPVVWEEELAPGPVGEYLEVVDHDPAGNCFYEPIDLNHPHLLATDGATPSEGNPKFHQQMVYAVAMTTIRHFEEALGRRALWSPRRYQDVKRAEDTFVPRLRIYPHALREANAYYSPDKKALMFGYFPAEIASPGRNLPGGLVFTCLSHDIIAHETTHALLDGMHQRFIEPSNPDTLALHEAFSDIVALFQHFTFPDVLRHQIARTRGDLASQNLLGQLAQQFGEAVGSYGALRDALGRVNPETKRWEASPPDPTAIEHTFEPHARGAILVAAIFDAFLAIYQRRVADLLRIATGGSGVLPEGELHPDLVNRLAREASKCAGHVLTMCIRALDYCPPLDVTFGEYLRAIITADTELIADDDLGYRIAITEAFRRRGLYPRDVRSLAPDSLVWDCAEDLLHREVSLQSILKPQALAQLKRLDHWDRQANRRQIYEQTVRLKRQLHRWFAKLRDAGNPRPLEQLTGLALTTDAPWSIKRGADDLPRFEIHGVWPARRIGPDGQLTQNYIIEITQRRHAFADPERQRRVDAGEEFVNNDSDFLFRGGATLVFEGESARLRYVIQKNIQSEHRLRRQREFRMHPQSLSLRNTYFGSSRPKEQFAALHRGH